MAGGNSPSTSISTSADAALRRNIELKARLPDIDRARAAARSIATASLPPQHQLDTYFSAAQGRLKLREIDGDVAQLVWYQRSDQPQSRGSNYLLVPVSDPAGTKQALASALGVVGVVEKQREIFLYQNVRIHLDCVVGRGTYLEFEAVLGPEQSDQSGHDQISLLRRHFEIADEDLLAASYGDA